MAKLMVLNYIIQYKKGRENVVADALSRCHEERSLATITIIVLGWCQDVMASYEGDEKVKELLEQLAMGSNGKEGYALVGGMIRYHGRIVIGNNEALERKILQALHESPLGGHSRIQNTYHRVRQLFYWPRLKTKVKEFVLACDSCKRCKYETVAHLGLLQPLPIPAQAPWPTQGSYNPYPFLPKHRGLPRTLTTPTHSCPSMDQYIYGLH